MIRFIKIIITLLVIVCSDTVAQQNEFLYFRTDDMTGLKTALVNGETYYLGNAGKIKKLAESFMNEEPFTIVSSVRPDICSDPHNYISEGPYWWPDPEDPDAAFIRKDGIRNPDRFQDHKNLLLKMYVAVSALSFAAYLYDDMRYANKAVEFIDTWFNNPETRMNPNLKYAQLIRNKPVVRGVGIIETHRFTLLTEAFNFLYITGYWRDESALKTKNWFRDFLHWLKESEYGLDEKLRGNNHSSWYAAQIAVYSFFTGDSSGIGGLFDYSRHFLIDNQIESNGAQPLEEIRTLSLNYSSFNLSALLTLSAALKKYGYNLYNYSNPQNASLETAISYLTPFLEEPGKWNKIQIKPVSEDAPAYLAFAGLLKDDQNYLDLYLRIKNEDDETVNSSIDDPFRYFLNMIVKIRLNNKMKGNNGNYGKE
ncbi:MAG: alginate lyase family protein [Melioribacteraceae bacterium]|nr:alginate lyase family protein [Melioribacteraceae bacterium]